MFYQVKFSLFRRLASIICLIVFAIGLIVPRAFADPGTSQDVPGKTITGWVDLSASVPDGFTGSVLVKFKNVQTEMYYSVESFVLNNFKNSSAVPPGNYVVEVVTTSEDPFLYNVVCNVEEFTLQDSFPLHVTVTKNEAGAEFLEDMSKAPEVTEDELIQSIESKLSESETSEQTEESEPEPVLPSNETEIEDDSEPLEEETKSEAEAPTRSLGQELLFRLIGILVFGGIFFAIYFLVRRKYR